MYLVVVCTVKNKREAERIAKALIKEKLAACINIFKVNSMYTWKNRFYKHGEYCLLIKTLSSKFENLKQKIKSLHSYTVPEIIALEIKDGNEDYLNWISETLK